MMGITQQVTCAGSCRDVLVSAGKMRGGAWSSLGSAALPAGATNTIQSSSCKGQHKRTTVDAFCSIKTTRQRVMSCQGLPLLHCCTLPCKAK
eukprot:1147905-Pelagomonas_calceolata.AAC.2